MVPFSAPNHQFHSILLFLIVTDITMATPINFPFPHFSPPPPPPPHVNPSPPPPQVHPSPPPPHVHPPPPPHVRLPPSPSQSHHTVIIIVSVSCGGVFFLAFLAAALFCFLKKKKKKKKKKKTVQETDFVHVDEPEKVKEAIVPGPHGPKAVLLEIEDDVHTDEKILKNEKYGKGLHSQSAEGNLKALEAGTAASSSSSSDHRRPWDQEYKG